MANFVFALTLTIVAGLSTAIGGLFVLFCKEANKKFLSFTMGFSAGVMVFIGLGDLLPIAAETVGNIPAFFTLFAGIAVAYIIDMAVPHHNPKSPRLRSLCRR
jgi:ZIP family zinc transporter